MNRYAIETTAETPADERTRLARAYLRAILRTNPSIGAVETTGIRSSLAEVNPVAVELLERCDGVELSEQVEDVLTGTTDDGVPAVIAVLELLSPRLDEVVVRDDDGRVLFARHDASHHYFDATADEKRSIVEELDSPTDAERLRCLSTDGETGDSSSSSDE